MTCPTLDNHPVPVGIQPVPCDFVAADPATFNIFQVFVGIAAIGAVIYMLVEARRTRSVLPIWLLISSAMCSVLAEPLGDVIGGIYLPREAPLRMFTIVGRPMPVADICIWVFLGLSTYVIYRMMLRGASIRQLLIVTCAIGIAEVIGEGVFVKFNMMLYYSNHALVFGIPVSSVVQNALCSLMLAAVLVIIMPHVHGVRWLIFLFWMPCVGMGFMMATTIPSFLGIQEYPNISPVVGWMLALLAVGLNVLLAYALVNIDQVRVLREPESAAVAEEQATV